MMLSLVAADDLAPAHLVSFRYVDISLLKCRSDTPRTSALSYPSPLPYLPPGTYRSMLFLSIQCHHSLHGDIFH